MKKMPLTQGQFALVDDGDFEWLNQWKWHAKFMKSIGSYYAARKAYTSDGHRYTLVMHRQILGLEFHDKRQGHHIDHQTLNNCWQNLRIVTGRENVLNPKREPKGYCWMADRKKYQAQIVSFGKNIFLGYFDTPSEAHTAYLTAKRTYHHTEVTA